MLLTDRLDIMPDSVLLSVRLESSMNTLTPVIVGRFEAEADRLRPMGWSKEPMTVK
jgi:hypothetical protein